MAEKYYYLKLKEDFFDREEIKVIEAMESGHEFVNILLKLYLRSLKRNGKLMVTDRIPYSIDALHRVLGHRQETIQKAIAVFTEFGLLEVLDNQAIYMTEIQNFIGKSSDVADRKREYRQQIEDERSGKLLSKHENGQTSDKCPKNKGQMSGQNSNILEIEIEKELERETSDKCTKTLHPQFSVPINQTRYDNLVKQYGKETTDKYIGKAVNYVAAKGKKPYADYAAAAANYLDKDNVQPLPREAEVDPEMLRIHPKNRGKAS